jgi:hypothetical protein
MYLKMHIHLLMILSWESKYKFNSLTTNWIFLILNRYKVAKRDNDSVYFEKVPALSSLPAVQGI